VKALRKAIDAERRRAWSQAGETASSERFRALMIDVTAWVETGAWRNGEAAAEPIQDFAGQALKRHRKTFEKRRRAALGGDDQARHHLRIEAKKLRYAVEAFSSLYGRKRAGRYLHSLKELQEVLGVLNDQAAAEPLLASLALSSEAAFAAGELVGLKAAAKPRQVTRAAKAAKKLSEARPFWD
jgi:CHAD domain-containing protein